MKRRGDIDVADEVGWLLSTVEGARLLAQMAEGDPDNAARLSTCVHAVLRGAVEALRRLSTSLEGNDESRRTRRERR